MDELRYPMLSLSRLRMGTDGQGVTTLVAFHGCPLHCQYCLNAQCLQASGVWREMEVEDILSEVMVDDLYFKATNGGITFGGGEPLLRYETIAAFCELCPEEWRIYIETSLNVEQRALEAVAPHVDHYYIDVKDMNADIYRRYSGIGNSRVVGNLRWLSEHVDPQRVTIRLPHIPDYNTQDDIRKSQAQLEAMGFTSFDVFEYVRK